MIPAADLRGSFITNNKEKRFMEEEAIIVGIEHSGEGIDWNSVKIFSREGLANLYYEGLVNAHASGAFKRRIPVEYGEDPLQIPKPATRGGS